MSVISALERLRQAFETRSRLLRQDLVSILTTTRKKTVRSELHCVNTPLVPALQGYNGIINYRNKEKKIPL